MGRGTLPPVWPGRAQKAPAQPQHRFGTRDERRNESLLNECWRDIRQAAASGGDRIRAQDDARHREENLHPRLERRKRTPYRATRVRRPYIPQGEGKRRPLGLPAVEDTRRPRAVTRRRQAIDAQAFRRCRDGYRPPGGALDAVDRLTSTLPCGRYNVVVEADLKGGCDTIEPGWVGRRLEERLEEGAFWRLITQGWKAGGLDTDGQGLQPATGTPQGGSRSPSLAKVYVPEALDLGFPQGGTPRCRGDACLLRDADDCVGALEYQADAERFSREGGQRLGKFGLELAAGKTRGLPFTRQQVPGHPRFDVRGGEGRWGRDRAGKPHLKRRTSRQRRRDARQRVTDWCKERCRRRLKDWCREVTAKWRGYSHHDGVHGNSASLQEFLPWVMRILFPWRNRRTQRRSSTGTGVRDLVHPCRGERPHSVGRPPTR